MGVSRHGFPRSFSFCIVSVLCFTLSINAMWPQPAEISVGETVIWLSPQVQLRLEGLQSSSSGESAPLVEKQQALRLTQDDTRKQRQYIESAFKRIVDSIFKERYVPDKFYPIGFDFDPIVEDQVFIKEVAIIVSDPSPGSEHTSKEIYTLDVTKTAKVQMQAMSYVGALHALESFRQLFRAHSDPTVGVYIPDAPISIHDGPRFEHRGLNLDIARNRIYPEDVLRTLDGMAAQKLNRLHLHATDSQSWPLDIPSMPELAQKGAYHRSQIWTQEHLEHVQAYGAERGIEVYVEIDMPGHTASISHSFPKLTVAYGDKWDVYAMEPPAGQLKLAEPEVVSFIKRLFDDLLPRLLSSNFHVGCDELNLQSYLLEPGLETADRQKLKPYVQAFFDHVFGLLERYGRTPVAWEEILLDWDLRLPKSAIIQSWRSQESLAHIAARGHRAIFGPSSHWYLDCGFGTWADPEPGNPQTKVRPPFPDWCPPYKNWRLVYSYDPLEGVPVEQQHLIIGGEAHLWGELTDSVTLDGMLWPRLAAAAEVLWSGKREVNEFATRRLAEARERLVSRKIAAGMVQMEWCLQNPGGCSM